jgi:organic radical activating enzyme
VEEPLESTEGTLFFQERLTHHPCNSSLIRKPEPSRVGNTKTDQLIFNHQVHLQTSRFGALILTGGKPLRHKEITLLLQEEE